MLSFKDFYINEMAQNTDKVSANQNTALGTAGEKLTAAHILHAAASAHRNLGNNEMASTLQKEGDKHIVEANKLLREAGATQNQKDDAFGRSKAVASSFLAYHTERNRHPHQITAVHHTAKPGDVERVTGIKTNQEDDPADLVVHYEHNNTGPTMVNGQSLESPEESVSKDHGLSYKHNKSSTLSTPGTQSFDASLGTTSHQQHKDFQREIKAERERGTSENELIERGHEFSRKMGSHISTAFNNLDLESQREHVSKNFKQRSKLPTIKIEGIGTGGNYKSKITPMRNPVYTAIKNAVHFSAESKSDKDNPKGAVVHYTAHDANGNMTPIGYSENRFTHSGLKSFGFPVHLASANPRKKK